MPASGINAQGGCSPYDDSVRFTLEHVALRRTSENEPFPWLLKLATLVRVARDGTVQQAKTDGEKRALLGAARDGDLVLAAWPGEWSQDIFVVDDLRAARIALGLPRNGTTEAPTPTGPLPGRRRESHPPSPTDPDVSLSAHPARAVQLSGRVPQCPVREQAG